MKILYYTLFFYYSKTQFTYRILEIEFAKRKCESNGFWGKRPNDTTTDGAAHGWTDYQPCFKPEVYELMQQVPNLDVNQN